VVATGFFHDENWYVGDETRDASYSSDDGLADVIAVESSGGGSFASDYSSGTHWSSSSSTTTYSPDGEASVVGGSTMTWTATSFGSTTQGASGAPYAYSFSGGGDPDAWIAGGGDDGGLGASWDEPAIEPTPPLYEGYWWEVGKGLKGYFYDAPKSLASGVASAVAHPIRTIEGIGDLVERLATDPGAVVGAVGDAVGRKLESGTEGQAELFGDVALAIFGPQVLAKAAPLVGLKKAAETAEAVEAVEAGFRGATGAGWAGDLGAAARYAEILATDDVAALAKHAGVPENVVSSVKTHLFDTVHEIPIGPDKWYVGRFHPSTEIADLWQAASRGERIDEFRLLIGHEYAEHVLMKYTGLPYRSPHPSAWDEGASMATSTHFGAHDMAPHAWEPRPLSDLQIMMWENFLGRP